ncbi:MAG: CPBP family intramembrane metalloprotease [Oscillospiraceae bacterium]|nr:CPBP family intramembrane metalloprotease [Oscillospiraceae bacterium]
MQETDGRMIDVVEAFSCPHQTEGYMKSYREWRRRKHNRYAFCFTKNPKEAAFSENQSVVNGTPLHAEQNTLQRIGLLYGYLLVGSLVIENLVDKLLVWLMGAFGLHIELMIWGDSRLYGDEHLVFWTAFMIHLLKYLVPAIAALIILRMPAQVSFPLHITGPLYLLTGMLLVMLMSVGMGMFLVSRSAEMEKYRLIDSAVSASDRNTMLYVLLTVLILPVAFELLLHGCMFQLLRQFGDLFAILATTILGALLTHNLQDALRIGLLTLTISYFMIQSGSFLTAIVLHVVHEIYMFALYSIETFGVIYSWTWWAMILLPVVLGLAAGVYLLVRRFRRRTEKVFSPTYLGLYDQCSAFFISVPMMMMAVVSVLLMIVTAFLV